MVLNVSSQNATDPIFFSFQRSASIFLTGHKSSHSMSQKTNNGFTFREISVGRRFLVNDRFCQMLAN